MAHRQEQESVDPKITEVGPDVIRSQRCRSPESYAACRQRPSKVEVIDRIPVSRHQDIETEIPRAATSPTQTNLDDHKGVLLWRKTLGPGEVWRIQHQFQISYPAAMRLVD